MHDWTDKEQQIRVSSWIPKAVEYRCQFKGVRIFPLCSQDVNRDFTLQRMNRDICASVLIFGTVLLIYNL